MMGGIKKETFETAVNTCRFFYTLIILLYSSLKALYKPKHKNIMQKLVFVLLLNMAALCTYSQTPTGEKANYQLASRFSGAKLERMVFSTSVDPHWLKNSDRFWYSYETTEGRKWYLV